MKDKRQVKGHAGKGQSWELKTHIFRFRIQRSFLLPHSTAHTLASYPFSPSSVSYFFLLFPLSFTFSFFTFL